jgi:hypothetical protein
VLSIPFKSFIISPLRMEGKKVDDSEQRAESSAVATSVQPPSHSLQPEPESIRRNQSSSNQSSSSEEISKPQVRGRFSCISYDDHAEST